MAKQSLSGKVALITGASSGIGRATALALAGEGARVALASRNRSALEKVAREIQGWGGEASVVPGDVTDRNQVERMAAETTDRWKRVDILVAGAGAYVRCPAAELSLAEMQRSLAVNFYGAISVTMTVLPSMLARKEGHLVLISSMDARKGIPPDAPYAAAKAALRGWGEVLRQELHGTGVHATIVFPGRVDTPLIAGLSVPRISAKISPHKVARAIVRAIYRRSPELIIPASARVLLYLDTLSPRLGDWMVRRLHLEGRELKREEAHDKEREDQKPGPGAGTESP